MQATFTLIILAILSIPALSQELKERPLVNEDIVALTKAGLPPAVIASKIRSSLTDFDTSVETLVELASSGIHADVLAAMTGAEEKTSAPDPAASGEPDYAEAFRGTPCERPGIYIREGDVVQDLVPANISQQLGSSGFKTRMSVGFISTKAKAAIRGAASDIRIENAQPSFLFCFASPVDPREFPLLELQVHPRRNLRSFVAGKRGIMGSRTGTAKELQTTIQEIQPGVYEVEPADSLTPGEYGFFSGSGPGIIVGTGDSAVGGSTQGVLFPFGID